jgi:hypothetical protein
MSGEGSSVDTEASNKWRKNVTPVIKQYVPKNIFNMVEMAQFYNVQPKSMLAFKGGKVSWRKVLQRQDDCTTTAFDWGQIWEATMHERRETLTTRL